MSQQRTLFTSLSRCSLAASSSRNAVASSSSRTLHSTASASAIGADPPRQDNRRDGSSGEGGKRERGRGRTGGRQPPMPPYEEWIKKAGAALRIPPPTRGPHWIGTSPFPLNPTFKPPPPLAAHIRAAVWEAHASDPNGQGTPRQLSTRFGIAIERVHAVLRLKALEQEWQAQNKPLQTHFEVSMEHLLGSVAPPRTARSALDAAAARLAAVSSSSTPQPAGSTEAKATSPDAPAKPEAQVLADAMPKPERVERTSSAAEIQRRQSEEATPVPSAGSTTGEIRGPHREIFDEGSNDPSVIAPALAASLAARRAELSNIASDTPVPSGKPELVSSSSTRPRTRPPLRIVSLGAGSYSGAGVVERNAARAQRRSRSRQMAREWKLVERKERELKEEKKQRRLALTREWEKNQALLKAQVGVTEGAETKEA